MTKIPLRFTQGRIIADVMLDTEAYRIRYKPIKFMIDTGSSRSFLSEKDAYNIKMPLGGLHQEEAIKMGGSKYELCKTKKVTLIFRTEENQIHKVTMPSFTVSRSTKKSEEARQESYGIPSIIGTDFFIANKMFLHFDPSESNIYLGANE